MSVSQGQSKLHLELLTKVVLFNVMLITAPILRCDVNVGAFFTLHLFLIELQSTSIIITQPSFIYNDLNSAFLSSLMSQIINK